MLNVLQNLDHKKYSSKNNLITLTQNMDCVAQPIKISSNLVHALANSMSSKLGLFRNLCISNIVCSIISSSIYALSGNGINYNMKLSTPILEGEFVV